MSTQQVIDQLFKLLAMTTDCKQRESIAWSIAKLTKDIRPAPG